MPQELTSQERAAFIQLLQDTFAEQQVQTLLAAFERLTFRSDPARMEQALQDLQVQVVEGQQSLQGALEKLAEAQARTEGRVGNLEAAMERMAAAQARTDEGLQKLAAAQARTDESLKVLSQEQAQTQRVVRDLARQVGGLSNRLGGDLEDVAYIVLHDVLDRELGWQVGELKRDWQKWNGETVELDIFGQAQDPKQPELPIWVVGEAKYNLTLREVERFAERAEKSKAHLDGDVFVVCFCYRARPEVQERLQELGIRLVFSYGRLV